MHAFLTAARQHSGLYALILAFCLSGKLFSHAAGAAGKFLPFMYLGQWLFFLGLVAAIRCVYGLARWVAGGRMPGSLKRRLGEEAPVFGAGTLLCIGLALLHGTYTSVKTIVPDLVSFGYDPALAELDLALHGTDPWRLLTWLEPLDGMIQPIYSAGWLLLVVLVTTLVATGRASPALKARYAWTFALCWILLGNLVSSLTLAAGPVYYERVTGSPRFAELALRMSAQDGPFSAYKIQERLWMAYTDQTVGLASGISAFPSMHVSIATLFVLLAWRAGWIARSVTLAFAGLILSGSVYLGWHYAVDGYFSILATVAIWKAVGWGLAGFPLRLATPLRPMQVKHVER